jgi:glycopeptide antibiotics resistance protein
MGGSWFPVEPDFLVHLLLFAPWMAAGRLLEKKNPGWAKPGCQISWFILGLFVAAGAESLQYVLYYRVFSPADLALNSIGVLAGWMLLTVFSKIKKS